MLTVEDILLKTFINIELTTMVSSLFLNQNKLDLLLYKCQYSEVKNISKLKSSRRF
jgi:hypothetical protein